MYIGEKTSELLHMILKMNNFVTFAFSGVNSIKKKYNFKRQFLPNIQSNIFEIHLVILKWISNENICYIKDFNKHLVVFVTDENLTCLKDVEVIYVDEILC